MLWALPAAGVNILKPYQAKRLTGFTHPDVDPQGDTYNLRQSITAVGAGGLRGRGVQGATQTRLNYLPEHATDFAFASLSEEHGFFGASILMLLYLLVVWRALKIVTSARDLYCAIVAGGIAFMFLFQVFVNSAMTMGIAPITGIPLPFVSVGGSSMITNFLAMGILQAIYMRRVAGRRDGGETRRSRCSRSSGRSGAARVTSGRWRSPARVSSCRCSRASCVRAVIRPRSSRGASRALQRSSGSARPTRTRCARPRAPASRSSLSPTTAPSPYVLAEDIVRVPPGQGFPVDAIARAVARRLGEDGTALAAKLPVLRPAVATS